MKLTDISPAIALTPLDGRYHKATAPLVEYMSEPALNRERMRVEVEWMILLANGFEGNGNQPIVDGVKPFTAEEQAFLRAIPEDFGAEGIKQHAAHEAITHHDVKAVEYYIDDQIDKAPAELANINDELKTLVHFACTSEDINNLSIARCVKNAMENVWTPEFKRIIDHLAGKAEEFKDMPLLSLTHGQPATPTTLGKELAVYVYRLNRQLKHIENQEYLGKINGATGTFGAHLAACPDVDWVAVSREFVTNRMGLTWNPLTTQIESHDWQAELYSTVSHANRIMHNLCVDVWMYISRGVFAQVPVKGATGSSTMPHKVNPIRFENAEANFEISCSLLDTLSATLVESRWQRDLTDSTTQRNIGSALGYSLLALTNLMGGLESIHPNTHVIERELDENWEVLGEPIQTAMRACELKGLPGMDKPYEKVKELMRGHTIDKEQVEQFIDQQSFDPETAARLKALTPATYTGVWDKIRTLFAKTPEAQVRGYGPGRFSFNVKGGRCEACHGDGTLKIEMNFLPDVYVDCEVCHGKRYNRETLEVTYNGKTVADILNMPIEEAADFFKAYTGISRYLKTLVDVGLGYIRLGQPAPTLSGGESQRVKLATELQRRSDGKTVYILDEPTTGLHFEDVNKLLKVLQSLVDKGNTVIVIEHNLDVIKEADWLIDLGPEGGDGGGTIVTQGTPEQVAECEASWTGKFLKPML